MNNLIILVSGGRSSGAMARIIQTSEKYAGYNKLYCFCNTGQEKQETIDFLHNMVKYWKLPLYLVEGVYSEKPGVGVRHRIVDFDTLDMDSKVFEGAIMQLNKLKWTGVPNQATPYCSSYLKTRVSHSFAKSVFETTNYTKAIGYRKEDIPKRIILKELKEDKNRIAPLLTDLDEPVGNIWLNKWWDSQPFKLQIHNKFGNCELCWKKSKQNLIECIQNGVRSIPFYQKNEGKYGNMFFRDNLSINDLIKLAESGTQLNLLENDLIEDSCVCNF